MSFDPSKDYYAVLGVQKTATEDEIKVAFRALAKQHHPDKGGDPDKFKEINEAFQCLSNQALRQQYDQDRNAASQQAYARQKTGARPTGQSTSAGPQQQTSQRARQHRKTQSSQSSRTQQSSYASSRTSYSSGNYGANYQYGPSNPSGYHYSSFNRVSNLVDSFKDLLEDFADILLNLLTLGPLLVLAGRVVAIVVGGLIALGVLIYAEYTVFKGLTRSSEITTVAYSSEKEAVVTGNDVYVYTTPASNGTKVLALHRQEKITVIGKAANWFQIKTKTGIEGYVSSFDIKIEP